MLDQDHPVLICRQACYTLFFTSSDYEAAQELKIITQKDHKYVPDMGQCQRD